MRSLGGAPLYSDRPLMTPMLLTSCSWSILRHPVTGIFRDILLVVQKPADTLTILCSAAGRRVSMGPLPTATIDTGSKFNPTYYLEILLYCSVWLSTALLVPLGGS